MPVLVPMNDPQYRAFLEKAIPAYAAGKVASGNWACADSLELATRAYGEFLPRGLQTPNNYFFTIRNAESAVVGTMWIATKDRAGKRAAYVYDVSVESEHQRKGYASLAFRALEEEVQAMGLSGIELHVFGQNVAAQALYAKLGYRPTNITMYKAVGSAGA